MDGTGTPRAHHYEFAHRALPAILLNPSIDLTTMVEDRYRLEGALRATWDDVGDRHPQERLEPHGLAATACTVGARHGLLVTLPEPHRAAEAFFVLVTPLGPQGRRFLTLELSWDVLTGSPGTVLGGWTPEGHLNLGEGPVADPAAFVDAVARRL